MDAVCLVSLLSSSLPGPGDQLQAPRLFSGDRPAGCRRSFEEQSLRAVHPVPQGDCVRLFHRWLHGYGNCLMSEFSIHAFDKVIYRSRIAAQWGEGQQVNRKLELLKGEGIDFDKDGFLCEAHRKSKMYDFSDQQNKLKKAT